MENLFRQLHPTSTPRIRKTELRATHFLPHKVVFFSRGAGGLGVDVYIVLQKSVPVQREAAPAGTELRGRGDHQSGPGSAWRLVGGRAGWRQRMVPLKLRPGPGGKTRTLQRHMFQSQLNPSTHLLTLILIAHY